MEILCAAKVQRGQAGEPVLEAVSYTHLDVYKRQMEKPDTEKPAELNIEKSNTQKSITQGASTCLLYTSPISHEVFEKARNGAWGVYLTPTKTVPQEWFGEMRGKKILGFASGGGQQMPVFTALGADCTGLDYSTEQ